MNKVSLSIYKTLFYQSIFDCSPRLSDFSKWLICALPISEEELLAEIKKSKDVSIKKAHICLQKEDFINESVQRVEFSKQKIELARKYAGILSKIPWYRMVAISGAVASYNATEDDDIDLFVIVAPQRIWFARFSDWIILNLLKARRNAKSKMLKNRICINYYLSEDSLTLENKDLYTANEIARLIPLYGENVYRKFVLSNSWVKDYLANFWKIFEDAYGLDFDKQMPFRFVLFDLLENLLGKFQVWYMKRKMTKEVVSESEIRFHPKDVRTDVLKKYESGLVEFKTQKSKCKMTNQK